MKHHQDFVVFYLNGDCNGDEEVEIVLEKDERFWSKGANQVYEGVLAEPTACTDPLL